MAEKRSKEIISILAMIGIETVISHITNPKNEESICSNENDLMMEIEEIKL